MISLNFLFFFFAKIMALFLQSAYCSIFQTLSTIYYSKAALANQKKINLAKSTDFNWCNVGTQNVISTTKVAVFKNRYLQKLREWQQCNARQI